MATRFARPRDAMATMPIAMLWLSNWKRSPTSIHAMIQMTEMR